MSPLAERLAPVTARLGRIRGSIRRLFALDGLSRLLLAAAAFVAATFLVDWALILPAPVRLVLLVGGIVLFGWVIARRVFYPLSRRITDDDLALFVERENPDLNDRLISAIQLSREPLDVPAGVLQGKGISYNSPELVAALVEDAQKATTQVDFGRVLVRRHVTKIALWALLAAGFLAALGAAFPVYAHTYLSRILGGSTKWPQRTHLTVLDFQNSRRVVARGDDLAIAVEYKGRRPSKVVLEYEFKTGEKGAERMIPMAGDRFQFTFPRVSGPFEFTVTGGDDTTFPHYVDTVTPPSTDAVRLFYEYPPYIHKPNTPPDRPETSGNVIAPIYTKVRFEAVTNEDIKAAELALGPKGKEKVTPLEVQKTPEGKPRLVGGSFEVTELHSEYSLQLTAQNGLHNRDPIRFQIKGIPDREPEVIPLDPQGDEFITEVCERPLVVEVRDDYGIRIIMLHIRVVSQQKEKSKEISIEFTRDQNSRDYGELFIRSEYTLDVSKFQLQAGDHVEIYFQAEDYKDIGTRNIKKSRPFKLSIVSMGTLEKELQDAIEKIKILLKAQKARQETAWNRSGRLLANFGKLDLLVPEQQGEVRQAGLEQNDITSKLDGARKDIRHIQRRGVYNKIYNDTAAAKLQGAIDELDLLVGTLDRDGFSRVAAARLDTAAKLRTAADRTQAFRDAQDLQSRVAAGIQRALDYLEKWSSYQEVIRQVRELRDKEKQILEDMKKLGTGPACPHGRKGPCPECEKEKK